MLTPRSRAHPLGGLCAGTARPA